MSSFLFPHHLHLHLHNISNTSTRIKYQHRLLFLQTPRLLSISISKGRAIRSPKFDVNLDDDDFDSLQPKTRNKGPRSKKQSQARWWSLLLSDDDVDDDNDNVESGFIDQLVRNLWILQVFKSYGWFLPIILLSFLIATGPKAFLMASGILFGLSIVIFAFRKLLEWLEGSPKPRKRRKKRSKSGRRKGVFIEEDDQEESLSGTRNTKRDFQSWVARNNGSFYDKDSRSEVGFNNFGGWDDLVGEDDTQSPPKSFRETERLERMMEKERLSRSMEERDLPLLLKIMVAVFPFLASWTNMM